MHRYRSHTCGELRPENEGDMVRLSGWAHRIRDHGGVLFVDLRDHYGVTQCVCDPDSPAFKDVETVRSEWVVRIDGRVKMRDESARNENIPTGAIEVFIDAVEVLSKAGELPLPIFGEPDYPEDIRLKYRFLDLRRETLHRNIMRRSQIISSIRRRMIRRRLLRVPDADPDRVVPRRRARLPRAVAPPSRQVLRTAAGAATVQAAPHGGGLRPLFPDRAVLPATRTPARTGAPASSTNSTSR